jgi:hypothetical protein
MMNLRDCLGKCVRIISKTGLEVDGTVCGFSWAKDNDESGEDELTLRTKSYPYVNVTASEIASIQILETAQSKKRFPLVAASL